MTSIVSLAKHVLPDGSLFYSGSLPDALVFDQTGFDQAWDMQPSEYHEIMIHGRRVKTPRKQQAFERDYHYTGRDNKALPTPALLKPLLDWGQQQIDSRLSAVLVNWYDGILKHYIGPHRDSTVGMVPESAIVTMSFGATRIFRLRPLKGKGCQDFLACNGTLFVMPFSTNRCWKHEVPHSARHCGRRISVTLRALQGEVASRPLFRA